MNQWGINLRTWRSSRRLPARTRGRRHFGVPLASSSWIGSHGPETSPVFAGLRSPGTGCWTAFWEKKAAIAGQ